MKRKPIYTKGISELEKLPTKVLLSRLNQLWKCEEAEDFSDLNPAEKSDPNRIYFKDTPIWKKAYEEIKLVLSKREHIVKGKDAKAKRMGKNGHIRCSNKYTRQRGNRKIFEYKEGRK